MSLIEEFIDEINKSESMQEEFASLEDMESVDGFLEKNNCKFSIDELIGFFKESFNGELSDDVVAGVSGGSANSFDFPGGIKLPKILTTALTRGFR